MTSVNGNNFNIYQGGICQPAGMPVNGAPVGPGSPELFGSAESIGPSFSPMGFMNQSNGSNGIDGYPSYNQDDCGCMPYPGMGGGNGINGSQLMALFQMMMGFLCQLGQQSNQNYSNPVAQNQSWLDALKAGGTMNISLDNCSFSDTQTGCDAWNSPLENLQAGQTYSVQYNSSNNSFTTTGLYQMDGKTEAYTKDGGNDLSNNSVNLWGYNEQIEQDPTTGQLLVVDPQYGVIGHATISQ